jgi:hypothetical protein
MSFNTNSQVFVINSVIAKGGNATISADQSVSVSCLLNGNATALTFKRAWIKDFSVQPYVAEDSSVWDSTITSGASGYQIRVDGFNKRTKQPQTWLSPILGSATSTVSQISDLFIDWGNGLGEEFSATFSKNGNEFKVTADTYFPTLKITNVGVGATGISQTTAGVESFGWGAQIIYFGNYSSSDVVSTNNYTTVTLYINPEYSTLTGLTGSPETIYLYVNQGDNDYPTLVGYNSTQGIGFGTLASVLYNNRQAVYSDVGANVAVASSVATRASGSFFTENIRSGQGFVVDVGSSAVYSTINVPYTDGATAANLIFTNATVTGANVSSAAALLVNYIPLAS